MAPNNTSQIAFLSALVTIPVLLASTLYLLPAVRLKQTPQAQRGPKTVHLKQLNPGKGDADTDIDIIAIHGLDTQSADTWRDKNTGFNWLHHLCLGPDRLDRVRVFTWDWLAALFQPTNLVQKTPLDGCKDHQTVVSNVRGLANKIRISIPLNQADEQVRTKHYTRDRLKIERLNGRGLEMEQCYINLTMVQTSADYANLYMEGERDIINQPFSFSLQTRLQIDTQNDDIPVELSTLFSPRKTHDNQTVLPKRILIRGRAGAGKTTLCKKIVFEFKNGTWPEWHKLFDRVLWIPLRKLKGRAAPGYNFQKLFLDEYLRFSDDKETRAQALTCALKGERTLFLLDGLDEVSQDFSHDSDMFDFLRKLIKQPNMIITAQP
ncbi:hypothetical protein ANO14919_113510 [Xylariales sp. No.14919]|nr:hypothetical protein ANO14919_113510 [Xylariales sp. No.14919]